MPAPPRRRCRSAGHASRMIARRSGGQACASPDCFCFRLPSLIVDRVRIVVNRRNWKTYSSRNSNNLPWTSSPVSACSFAWSKAAALSPPPAWLGMVQIGHHQAGEGAGRSPEGAAFGALHAPADIDRMCGRQLFLERCVRIVAELRRRGIGRALAHCRAHRNATHQLHRLRSSRITSRATFAASSSSIPIWSSSCITTTASTIRSRKATTSAFSPPTSAAKGSFVSRS